MATNKKNQRRQRQLPSATSDSSDKPVTLKDMLGAGTVAKLKQHAEALKQEEAKQQEEKRLKEEAARQAQQKLKENDFEYLLNNSGMDWKKFKS
ncbi:YqkE family protein [Cohnella silvisoli]|uniref:YqkE family protein n=1 Tax=Cohnella silvisoli TaxID=2873699 RepID=A0ABV1KYB5_9BACL|nr:YqkE family protein [Cohnella silvisoli]MCD9021772.1 YqkE family protein [Cohnella silvisoli]